MTGREASVLGVREQQDRVQDRRAAGLCTRPVPFTDYCWRCSTWHDPEPEYESPPARETSPSCS